MSVRMRHTREHTRNRRSHHALKDSRLSKCSNCGESHLRHSMCTNCGVYRGRQVIDVAAKIAKKEEKKKAKVEAKEKAVKETKDADKKADAPLDAAALSGK